MGFFDFFRKKQLQTDERTRYNMMVRALYNIFGGTIQSAQFTNVKALIEEGFKRNADVFAVVNWISENAANVPLKVERYVGDSWELDPMNPLQKVIDKPNPYMSGLEFRHQCYGFYNVTGNNFIYGPKLEMGANAGQARTLWIMPSQYVEIHTGDWMQPIESYSLTYTSNTYKFSFDDVMHMKTLNLDYDNGSQFFGMSPLQAGLLSLDRSNSNYTYAAYAFKNGGKNGILSVEGEELSPNLTDEQRTQAERQIRDDYKGVMNANKSMVTNGVVNWTEMGFSPVDLNLLADKKATLRDICSIYGISSILFNDNENSTYNNVSEAKKSAYNDVIMPLVNRFVQELNEWLVPSYGMDLRIVPDYSGVSVLQSDKAEQSKWLTEQVNSGQMTRNEARIVQGLDPIESEMMDTPTVTMGTTPIDDIRFDPFIETPEAAKAAGKHYLEK